MPRIATRPPCAICPTPARSASGLPTSRTSRRSPRASRAPGRPQNNAARARRRRASPPCAARSRAFLVEVGDDDVPRTGVPRDRDRHAADRPGAGDEHVLAEDGKRECRVDGVAERVEDRGDLVGDAASGARRSSSAAPRARRTRRALHAEPGRPRHRCLPAGHAVPAAAADHVPSPLTRSPGSKPLTFDPTSTTSPTNSCPITSGTGIVRCAHVPQVDVDVGAADAGGADADQDVVDPDLRLRHLLEPQPRLGAALGRAPSRRDPHLRA